MKNFDNSLRIHLWSNQIRGHREAHFEEDEKDMRWPFRVYTKTIFRVLTEGSPDGAE